MSHGQRMNSGSDYEIVGALRALNEQVVMVAPDLPEETYEQTTERLALQNKRALINGEKNIAESRIKQDQKKLERLHLESEYEEKYGDLGESPYEKMIRMDQMIQQKNKVSSIGSETNTLLKSNVNNKAFIDSSKDTLKRIDKEIEVRRRFNEGEFMDRIEAGDSYTDILKSVVDTELANEKAEKEANNLNAIVNDGLNPVI